jgi:hypothetical protein
MWPCGFSWPGPRVIVGWGHWCPLLRAVMALGATSVLGSQDYFPGTLEMSALFLKWGNWMLWVPGLWWNEFVYKSNVSVDVPSLASPFQLPVGLFFFKIWSPFKVPGGCSRGLQGYVRPWRRQQATQLPFGLQVQVLENQFICPLAPCGSEWFHRGVLGLCQSAECLCHLSRRRNRVTHLVLPHSLG